MMYCSALRIDLMACVGWPVVRHDGITAMRHVSPVPGTAQLVVVDQKSFLLSIHLQVSFLEVFSLNSLIKTCLLAQAGGRKAKYGWGSTAIQLAHNNIR